MRIGHYTALIAEALSGGSSSKGLSTAPDSMPSSGDLYPPPASASGGLENTLYHRKRKNVKLSVVRMVMSRKWIAEIMEFRTLEIK